MADLHAPWRVGDLEKFPPELGGMPHLFVEDARGFGIIAVGPGVAPSGLWAVTQDMCAIAAAAAAAPEMLDALRGALVVIETLSRPDDLSTHLAKALDDRQSAIHAAIAKAEGRAP